MQGVAIVALCVASAVGYALGTYIAFGHLPLLSSEPASFAGLARCVRLSWWFGLLLGVPLAAVARLGPWPKRGARSMIEPLIVILYVAVQAAFFATIIGYALAGTILSLLPEGLASRVPEDRPGFFLADVLRVGVSYLVGLFGGIAVMLLTWRSRRPPPKPRQDDPRGRVRLD